MFVIAVCFQCSPDELMECFKQMVSEKSPHRLMLGGSRFVTGSHLTDTSALIPFLL